MNDKATQDTSVTPKPWYRHPWLWFVIAIPAASVVAGIGLVVTAGIHADTVVDRDGWEKRGVLIAEPDSADAAPEKGDDGRR